MCYISQILILIYVIYDMFYNSKMCYLKIKKNKKKKIRKKNKKKNFYLIF